QRGKTAPHSGPDSAASVLRAARKRIGAALALAVLAAGLWLGTAPAARAQDGMPALKKMMAAYLSLNSYDGRAHTEDVTVVEKNKVLKHSSTAVLMQYKKPNRLRISISTRAGDHDVYSDGVNFYVYENKQKAYIRIKTTATLNAMLPLLLKEAGISAFF